MQPETTWEYIKSFFGIGFQQSAAVTLLAFLSGYFVSWYKRNTFFLAAYLRIIQFVLTGKKYILIWNDHKIDVSDKISQLLKDKNIKHRFVSIVEPDQLLKYPLSKKYVHEIILIVTDVTKLSESEKKRKQIQLKIINYVRNGGTLFGTHDLIYRRCRNKALQGAFGCETNNFLRVQEPVAAEVIDEHMHHPLLRGVDLDPRFEDGEVCYGEWDNDAIILIQSKDTFSFAGGNKIPMLVIRHTGNYGTLIWLNSADKSDELAKSLSEPYKEVIKILYNSIAYSAEIKEYYKTKIGHIDGDTVNQI